MAASEKINDKVVTMTQICLKIQLFPYLPQDGCFSIAFYPVNYFNSLLIALGYFKPLMSFPHNKSF